MTSYLSISHLILKRKMQCKDCKFFYNNFPLVIMNTVSALCGYEKKSEGGKDTFADAEITYEKMGY